MNCLECNKEVEEKLFCWHCSGYCCDPDCFEKHIKQHENESLLIL